jgi:formylglycine-generating enzyme required for sulfatase activity
MRGNCWEWTSSPFLIHSLKKSARARNDQARALGLKVLKGGSYLCHRSYCHRYRIVARTGNTPESPIGHTGFRLAFDIC